MTKYKTLSDFFAGQTADINTQIMLVRDIILSTEPQLIETLKWNAPNYVLNCEDRITFNVTNKEANVKLVLHMGATKKEDKSGKPVLDDTSGLIEWNSNIRGTITFESLTHINSNKSKLEHVIKSWLAI